MRSLTYFWVVGFLVVAITIIQAVAKLDKTAISSGTNHQQSSTTPESYSDTLNDIVEENNDDDGDIHGIGKSRQKRFIIREKKHLWKDWEIPYSFDKDLNSQERIGMDNAMKKYKENTPFHFVLYDKRKHQNGYAYFQPHSKTGRCQSNVGKIQKPERQNITCCTGDSCIHEIGHLLGFYHEWTHPERDSWISFTRYARKEHNVGSKQKKVYNNRLLDSPFDVFSYMRYGPFIGKDLFNTFTFPELNQQQIMSVESGYYMYKQLSEVYSFSKHPSCKGKGLTCSNDGYVSVIKNKCTCVCPEGFDPETRCEKPFRKHAGNVIQLNDTNQQYTIEYNHTVLGSREYHLIIKGDPAKDGSLILNFDVRSMKIRKRSLKVSFTRVGHPGIKVDKKIRKYSMRSAYKDLRIQVKPRKGERSYFKATVVWKPATELCYNDEDKGATYVGLVNYDRRGKSCLHWKDAIGKCPVHPFQGGLLLHNLQGNQCRNPDNSFRPWCYINLDNCVKQYCDVCDEERPFDIKKSVYCKRVKRENKCSIVHEARKCAKTCNFRKLKKAVTCPRKNLADSELIDPKSSYKVGQKAVFQCKKEPRFKIELTCRTDRKWSEGNTACTLCPVGWSFFNKKCYKHFKMRLTLQESRDLCKKNKAELRLQESDSEETQTIERLRHNDATRWIGDPADKLYGFICRRPSAPEASVSCIDFLDNCDVLMKNKNGVTCDSSPELKNLCRKSCKAGMKTKKKN